MSHKDLWNMIVFSREHFPADSLLHDLDVMALCAFMFLGLIAWIAIQEWLFCRQSKQKDDHRV